MSEGNGKGARHTVGEPSVPSPGGVLHRLYRNYHSFSPLHLDPIECVRDLADNRSREVAAWFVSQMAYGSARQIYKVAHELLSARGRHSFYDFILSGAFEGKWSSIAYRFHLGCDFEVMGFWVKSILETSGSLENFFLRFQTPQALTAENKTPHALNLQRGLSHMIQSLMQIPLPPSHAAWFYRREKAIRYLLPDPNRGSACKRLLLFLRWVTRTNDGIDLGLWKAIHPRHLLVPVDTHILRAAQRLSFTQKKTATWETACEITEALAKVDPEDPVRFDFALCHWGMEQHLIGKKQTRSPYEQA